ncbi:MAG: LLM class flavin-dependent oxidoreductase [Thaumarchaeota archaeon]|nr:LLM class flavin-dependent oxidoreductase [Nitrososphaerota archaeon]
MVKFGVKITQNNYSFDDISNVCLEAERVGFESFWVADHMFSWGRKPTEDVSLECWTILSSLATKTKRIRLGTLVVCNLFRPPPVLAKISSSFDVISGGRLEFGIGTCGPSTPPELSGYGFSLPKRAERLQRLRESIEILKTLWTQQRSSFQGQYYRLTDAICSPKPLQKPHPPIWIGGEREDVLDITAKYANGWNCRRFPLEQYRKTVETLDSYCVKYGRKPSDVQKSWQGPVLIGKDEADLKEKMGKYGINPGALVGTPDKITEQIQRYIDAGASYLMFFFQDDRALKSLGLFAEKVAPNF